MVRGKVVMKRIENAANRLVTFSKRRNGLLKKAFELSVLCDIEVAVVIFSQKGRLYEFSSSDMQHAIERYFMYIKEIPTHKPEMKQLTQHSRIETENMVKKIEYLEVSKRKLLGQGLGSCSLEELQEIDSQLEQSLKNIRARKVQLYKEQIQQLKAKERMLLEENVKLYEKWCDGGKLWQQPLTQQRKVVNDCTQNNRCSEIETELFIGLPQKD
ncbi:hypothetical protein SLEP1_g3559 [Rubroshorea leprosula]|uniref:Uncharacterized protein n=1 Tax=Rubroshorea leprosula TaxID=152421 RepID=A0AAV5HVD9_9ROSI|nr:hypothetical protein SLEP1_g3559 [Rubroshorea leprosula]